MLPYFYIQDFDILQNSLELDENNSRHAVQVLRMKADESLHITDGKGNLITASITSNHKKHCAVRVLDVQQTSSPQPEITIAIAPTKKTSRFEWFLEKAAELGVSRVLPLITKRTEKQKYKEERLQNILVSALLQSRQTRLLQLLSPQYFEDFIVDKTFSAIPNKYIAHCIEADKQYIKYQESSSIILIGPEGDFTPEEIEKAISSGYKPVTLGNTRLRTETAGIAVAAILHILH